MDFIFYYFCFTWIQISRQIHINIIFHSSLFHLIFNNYLDYK